MRLVAWLELAVVWRADEHPRPSPASYSTGVHSKCATSAAGRRDPSHVAQRTLPRPCAACARAGLHGLLKVAGNWTYSLFFCMAELWGAVVISVLFW